MIGELHYQTARATQKLLQDYKGLQDIIAILGINKIIYNKLCNVILFLYNVDKLLIITLHYN